MSDKPCYGYTLLSIEHMRALPGQTTPLIDMKGNAVHEWPILGTPSKMLNGGALLASRIERAQTRSPIKEPQSERVQDSNQRIPPPLITAVVQISWDGNEEWSFSNWDDAGTGVMMARQHHDLQREQNPVGYYAPGQEFVKRGKTLILAHKNKLVPEISDVELLDDVIYEVDWNGNLTGFEWHAADHFKEFGFDASACEAIYTGKRRPGGRRGAGRGPERRGGRDYMHINSVSLLGENHWYDETGNMCFHQDNIIISSRTANVVAIINRATGEVVWKIGPNFTKDTPEHKLGQFVGQHHAHMIPSGLPGEGNILVFDNGGESGYGGPNGYPRYERDYSRIIEFNPVTFHIIWEYAAENFFSHFISSAQRLPNGNTLITEGSKGRIFEVTPKKKIVWEFISPFKNRRGNEVYRAIRVPPEWVPGNPNDYTEWVKAFKM